MPESEEKPLVVIRSLVYNHEPYLRDCLEGFVMQQTTFPFVAVVHDDCSTDGSAAIIREYAEKYPHIIKPVYETENQYSKHDGSLSRAMDEACGKYGAKYIALCEGDDCWTDPHKLQKQVDFLEAHPDYTMVCCNGVVELADGKIETDGEYRRHQWPHIDETREITTGEAIMDWSVMILTAGIIYRAGIRDDYPPACRKSPVGDVPLQIMAAIKGRVHYMHDSMVVYRYQTPNSWSKRHIRKKKEEMLEHWKLVFAMHESLDEYSRFKHTRFFRAARMRVVEQILSEYQEAQQEILQLFGRHLLYETLKGCIQKPKGIAANVFFAIKRMCFSPYYPITTNRNLLLPFLRPFYHADRHKRTISIGRLGILSFVSQPSGPDAVYLFGKKVK